MTPLQIASAYEAAHKLVYAALGKSVHLDVIWRKLDRVAKYLDAAATEQLASTLSE